MTDGIISALAGKTRGRPPCSKFVEIRVTRVFLRFQPWKPFSNVGARGSKTVSTIAESAIRVIIWNLRLECSSNPKSSNGARNSRSIATLCSNLRRKRRRISRFVSAQKILHLRHAPVPRLRVYVTRKGKGGKASWLRGVSAIVNKKSTSIKDVRWIIAFRILIDPRRKQNALIAMQLIVNSTSQARHPKIIIIHNVWRTDFKLSVRNIFWRVLD